MFGFQLRSCCTVPAGHDILNISDDIVDRLGHKGVGSKRVNFFDQESRLIGNILTMDDTNGGAVYVVQGSTIDQVLQRCLDGWVTPPAKSLLIVL
jgi:hypothetical protein